MSCPQPCIPENTPEDPELWKSNLLRLAAAPKNLPQLGITGGEPTLLGSRFFELLRRIEAKLPHTEIQILTNGRKFSQPDFTRGLLDVKRRNLSFGIPLHADYADGHDHFTGVPGSYWQTLNGLLQLAHFNLDIELRILVTRLNYRRLSRIAEFVSRNLPFVAATVFMGLEMTGQAWVNRDSLWIDPIAYRTELEDATAILTELEMPVHLFNLPLCLLSPRLYDYARNSISDWKITYLPVCSDCSQKKHCGGLFRTSLCQSNAIQPFRVQSPE